MNTYEIGQTFEDIYPPEAAVWCNGNGALIVELEPQDGKRVFEIQEIPAPSQEVINAGRIAALEQQIRATDSIALEALEIALGGNLVMPVDSETDYAAVLLNRQTLRAELAELKKQFS